MAGACTESPLVRIDVGVVPAGQGSPLQDGETLANKHGKLLARVREFSSWSVTVAARRRAIWCQESTVQISKAKSHSLLNVTKGA